jgi:ATP-dependent DNA ligase
MLRMRPALLASLNLVYLVQALTRRPATVGFFRMLARRDGAGVRLLTRRGIDWTTRYPTIAAAIAALACRSCLIDGQVVICGEDGIPNGRASFTAASATGPRTPEGLESSRRANWKHGHSRKAKAKRSRLRRQYLRSAICAARRRAWDRTMVEAPTESGLFVPVAVATSREGHR